MKKCSTSLDIKKCKSKLPQDFISPQLGRLSSRAQTITNIVEDVAKQGSLYIVGGNIN
jgi:hypothetical protein